MLSIPCLNSAMSYPSPLSCRCEMMWLSLIPGHASRSPRASEMMAVWAEEANQMCDSSYFRAVGHTIRHQGMGWKKSMLQHLQELTRRGP